MRVIEYGDLPNAQPYPRRQVDSERDVDEGFDDATVDAEEPDPEDEAPMPRPTTFKTGHRLPKMKPATVSGPSRWERPRENFTESMAAHVPEMRATREARFVKGTTRES